MKTLPRYFSGSFLGTALFLLSITALHAGELTFARNNWPELYRRGKIIIPDADATSTWNAAIDGNWNDPTKWSSNPNFPNNGNGGVATYNAVISATGAAYTVTLSVPITIENLLLSSANATLNHTAGTFTATNGISLNAGTYRLNGGTISNTVVNVSGGTLAVAASTNNMLSGVTVNGDLTLADSQARTGLGAGTTFTTAHLSGVNSELGFSTGQTLSGTILFEGANGGGRNVNTSAAGAFTIGATGVIRTEAGFGGSGNIGGSFNFTGAMALTNQGLISSQVSGRTLTVQPDTLTNSGTMQALNGGILTISPTNSWSNAGTIGLDATSTVNLGGTFNTTGGIGTFANSAGGLVNITGTINNTGNTLTLNNNTGSWTLAGGTFNGGTLAFANGKTLFITASSNNLLSGVTINGDLTVADSQGRTRLGAGTTFTTAHLTGVNSELGFLPGQTLSGTILFENANGGGRNVNTTAAGAFTIGSTGVIRTETGFGGSGNIGGSFNFSGAMALTNQGLISSQVSSRTLTVQPDSLTNSGTMQALNGGILTISPTSTWTNAGTIGLDATSTVNLGGTFNTTGGIGTFANTAGGLVNIIGTINNTGNTLTLNNNTGSWTLAGGTFNGGTLVFANGKTLFITASTNNLLSGVTVNGDLTVLDNQGRTRLGAGTTFTTAHLTGVNSELGFLPGQTLSGTILFEGVNGGGRNVNTTAAGAFTIGSTGVIRTETGFGGSGNIGGAFNFNGAMALTNQGLISSQVSGRTLTVQPDTLTNSGTMQALNGGILTISPTSTWTNAGTIGLDASSTVNLGGTFNTTGGIGTFANTAGGLVNITGTVNNTGNTLTLDANTGSWTLAGGTFSGGTLAFANGKTLLITASTNNLLSGVTVNGDLTVADNQGRTRIGAGTTFTTAHLTGVNSELGFLPGQTLSGAILFEGANGGGRNVNTSAAGAFTIGSTGVIRTETGFGGSGNIGGSFNFTGAMALTNQGLISSQTSGKTITVQPDTLTNNGTMQALNGSILTISPTNTWTNAGTIGLDATSTVNLGGTFNTTGGIGTFANSAGGLVNIIGTINNTGNTLTLNNNTGSWTLAGGTFNGGTLGFAAGKTLFITASSNNLLSGVTVNGDLTLADNQGRTRLAAGTTFTTAHLTGVNSELGFLPGQTLSGTILFEGANGGGRNVNTTAAGAFTIGSSGVIRTETGFGGSGNIGGAFNFSGAMALTNQGLISSQTSGKTIAVQPASFTNQGTFEATNGGILSLPSGYTQTAGVTRVNNGTINAVDAATARQTITIAGGRLEGTGTVNANVANSAVISPGLSPGQLSISGDLTLASSSNLIFEIGGTTAGTQYDVLTEAGTVALNLNGTLSVSLINGFSIGITSANTFTIISSNQPIMGTFSNVVAGRLTTADGMGSFAINNVGNNVILGDFQAIPEPSSLMLLLSFGAGFLALRCQRAARHFKI